MANRHPNRVDARRLARQGVQKQMSLQSDDLPRLAESGGAVVGRLVAVLDYFLDEGRRERLSVKLDGAVTVPCERCRQPVQIDLAKRVEYALVLQDDAELPVELEPALVDEDGLDVAELLEDDILLSLPLSPMHDPEKVSCVAPSFSNPDIEVDAEEERPNPFAALAEMKVKN